jgi:DNA-binding NtrC family response regulator
MRCVRPCAQSVRGSPGSEPDAQAGRRVDGPGHLVDVRQTGINVLDETGELPLAAQVKLLRALQEGEIRRVGDTKTLRVDVGVIAATNRELATEVGLGRFREDLFYRLAVLVLNVPTLRQREGDVAPLIEGLLNRINDQSERAREPGFKKKKLSVDARKLLVRENWPGNIRELENTLRRAAVWSDGEVIDAHDIADAILPSRPRTTGHDGILNHDLSQELDLQEIIGRVARHYLQRALDAAHGNKSQAAKLLGLSSYQTLTNWLEKYGLNHAGTRPARESTER